MVSMSSRPTATLAILGLLTVSPRVGRTQTRASDESSVTSAASGSARTTVSIAAVAGLRQLRVGGVESGEPGQGDDETTPMATGMPVRGGGLELGVGGLSKHRSAFDWEGVLRYELGTTDFGLVAHLVSGGAHASYRLAPVVSLVFGLRVGLLLIGRASDGPVIHHWGLGADVGPRFDLVPIGERGALFVAPTVEALVIPHQVVSPRSLLWGGCLALGVRL